MDVLERLASSARWGRFDCAAARVMVNAFSAVRLSDTSVTREL